MAKVKLMQGQRLGYCQSEDCLYEGHEEKVALTYYRGEWLCDGCLEDTMDVEEFVKANRFELMEKGEY